MYWHGDWNWGAWIGMTVTMVAFWALVIWAIFSLVGRAPRRAEPEALLSERLARGEIDVADYQERLAAIRAARSQVSSGESAADAP